MGTLFYSKIFFLFFTDFFVIFKHQAVHQNQKPMTTPKIEKPNRYNVEEFLDLAYYDKVLYEFYNGHVYPKATPTPARLKLIANVLKQLKASLNNSPYQILSGRVLTQLQANRNYVFPDIVITEEVEKKNNISFVTQPTIVIDVLSPEHAAQDKAGRFFYYQKSPLVQQCIFIEQSQYMIETNVRYKKRKWYDDWSMHPNDDIEFPLLEVSLLLKDIYEGIHL